MPRKPAAGVAVGLWLASSRTGPTRRTEGANRGFGVPTRRGPATPGGREWASEVQRPTAASNCRLFIRERPLIPLARASLYSWS